MRVRVNLRRMTRPQIHRWTRTATWVAAVGLWSVLGAPGRGAEPAGRLVNISARAVAASGADVLAAGFVVTGDAPMRLLIRGAGPALGRLGVEGALAQVRLELFRGGTLLGTNLGWDTGEDRVAVAATMVAAGAFEFVAGSRDAALVVALPPGNYSAQVSPAGATAPGVALVEIYDVEPTTAARLVNLSARAKAGPAAETLIAGFVLAGDGRNRVLVRAAGPALTAFGVPGAITDPQLELLQKGVSVGYNNDWSRNTNPALVAAVAQASGAFAWVADSRDAALLQPGGGGAYTAQVSSVAQQSGVALVEIYDTAGQRAPLAERVFDLVGFARVPGHGLSGLSGGGEPTINYDPVARTGNFWRIDEAVIAGAGFAAQLQAALASDTPLVVELNAMIDLSRHGRANNGATAIAHPDLFTAGRSTGTVGTLALGSNKTIYSAYGSGGFRRGSLSIAGKNNVMLRNLKFRELWEWDDATTGEYDRNDWDYLNITSATSGANVTARAHHIWIDHCDFERSYDGLFDFVHGADLITVSWCKVAGAVSGESERWMQRQLAYLEANRGSFAYFNSRRSSLTLEQIAAAEMLQKKSNLVGNGTDASTAAHDTGHLNVTFHHNWYVAIDQRMPRLRFGNAHVFNLLADSRAGRSVGGLSSMGVAATSNGAVRLENSMFLDVRNPITISAGSEPSGRVTVVDSVNLDGVTLSDKGFDATRVVAAERFSWNRPAVATGLGNWPSADATIMPAGYLPAGKSMADYVDTKDFLSAHLDQVGVIVPADATEAALLRARWQTITATR